MNFLDIFFAIPLLWGLYKGITKGLIVEAVTILAFFLAVWVSVHFCDWLAVKIGAYSGSSTEYLPLIAFSVLFIGVLVGSFFVARLAERAVKAGSLGWLNKIGGAFFVLLKFGLILSLGIFIYEAVEKSYPMMASETKEKSLLYNPVSKIAPALIPGLQGAEVARFIPGPKDTIRLDIPLEAPGK